MISKNKLTQNDLREIAHGSPVTVNFRNMISEYYSLADKYRSQTLDTIKRIRPLMEPRYQLSLEIIFDLYLMVFERIDLRNGRFTTEELNPTPEQIKERVYNAILNFRII